LHSLENVELVLGDRGKLLRGFGDENLYICPVIVQMPGANQCAAAIATHPRQNGDSTPAGVTHQESVSREVGEIPPGIFHHLDQLNMEILDHGAIHFDHLGSV
jgi:hypothetical protein